METQKKTVLEKEDKTYTKTELFTYSGIAALVTGVIGYFIGENRGEKKAKDKYEHAVNLWKEKMEKRRKEDKEEEFIM